MKQFNKISNTPIDRPYTKGWHSTHSHHLNILKNSNCSVLLLGDSIAKGISRNPRSLKK